MPYRDGPAIPSREDYGQARRGLILAAIAVSVVGLADLAFAFLVLLRRHSESPMPNAAVTVFNGVEAVMLLVQLAGCALVARGLRRGGSVLAALAAAATFTEIAAMVVATLVARGASHVDGALALDRMVFAIGMLEVATFVHAGALLLLAFSSARRRSFSCSSPRPHIRRSGADG